MANVTGYVTLEEKRLADLTSELNERYKIGSEQHKHERPVANDDDDSFMIAGMPCAITMVD